MKKLLTVIIPVYKVEPYINKCLDSLLIYTNGEDKKRILDIAKMNLLDILIINDGTPDRSAEMSREYVNLYPEYFRQIDKENGGHGSVWNLGTKLANGKYIRFLDSDDWLENLDVLLEKLQETDADIVLTHTMDHRENNQLWKEDVKGFQYNHLYDMEIYDWNHHKGNFLCFLHHGSTFKKDILVNELPLFLENQPYDDSVLPFALINGGHTLIAYDMVVYHYLMDRPGQSISSSVTTKTLNAQMQADIHSIRFIERNIVKEPTPKNLFLITRRRKIYQHWFIPRCNLSFQENKSCTAKWDAWVRTTNPHIKTIWIKMYRSMPYCMYYAIAKCIQLLVFINAKLKNKYRSLFCRLTVAY